MDEYTKTAILSAIRTEKASHDFYLLAASRATVPETRNLLMKLAREEFIHLAGFIRLYPGEQSEIALLACDSNENNPGYLDRLTTCSGLDTREKALAVAIKEERSCIELYSHYVAAIRVPEVHSMFKKALEDTEKHLETIESEYACCMGMVNESEMDIYVRE